jgi:alanine racemase
MAVVKSDAYGHGIKEVAKNLIEKKIDYLGVVSLEEGIIIREIDRKIPVLILGYTPPKFLKDVIKNNLSQTIWSRELASLLNREARRQNKKVKVHLKIDTGMGRFGIFPEEVLNFLKEISAFSNLEIEGIFTHFSSADFDKEYTEYQFNKFLNILKELEENKIFIKIKHCANSAATLKYPEMHLQMVRCGILFYGLSPVSQKLDIKPVLSLKTKIVAIKELPPNYYVSYGNTYLTKKKTKIGIIPLGYSDGFFRLLSNKAEAIVKGKRVKLIGTICMDFSILELENIPDVKIGEEVVIIGRQKNEEITATEIAEKIGTINYEVVCAIGKKIPRIYKKINK